jgi:hypothetical protein
LNFSAWRRISTAAIAHVPGSAGYEDINFFGTKMLCRQRKYELLFKVDPTILTSQHPAIYCRHPARCGLGWTVLVDRSGVLRRITGNFAAMVGLTAAKRLLCKKHRFLMSQVFGLSLIPVLLFFTSSAGAQGEPFYKGKQIRIIVGLTPVADMTGQHEWWPDI